MDEQEERAKASTNSFLGQTIFTARIVSLPTEFQSVTVTVGGTDTTYQGIVKVRIEKLDRMLANPLSKGMTAAQTIATISQHTDAYVGTDVPLGLTTGDIVRVRFPTPPVGLTLKNPGTPVVIEYLSSDAEYADRILNNFKEVGIGETTFNFEGSSTLNDALAKNHPPRTVTYIGDPALGEIVLENGKYNEWPDQIKKSYVDEGQRSYTANINGQDVEVIKYQGGGDDGHFFLAHPTMNHAAKLQAFAIEYVETYGFPNGVRDPDVYFRIAGGTRSYDKQLKLYYDDDPTPAAKPGRSNHGFGIAFDLHPGRRTSTGGKANYNDPKTQWILANLSRYGFSNSEGKKVNEAWHHTIDDAGLKNILK